jgi:hypothetical protein
LATEKKPKKTAKKSGGGDKRGYCINYCYISLLLKKEMGQLNNVKKAWLKPKITLISKGYHVNGGPLNNHLEQNYTQSYFTGATPNANKILKGPNTATVLSHNANRHNYHS